MGALDPIKVYSNAVTAIETRLSNARRWYGYDLRATGFDTYAIPQVSEAAWYLMAMRHNVVAKICEIMHPKDEERRA